MPNLKIKILGDDSSLKNALRSSKDKLKQFGASIRGIMATAAKGALAAMAGLAVVVTKIGADFEQTAVSFRTMLGSGEKAADMLERLTKFSTRTPFKPEEIFAAAKTLLAFGASAREVHGIIKTIGDVSSATGKELNELAKIYGKVFVKGKMQAEELNQFSEAGVPIIKELQKQYNATAEEIFDMGSKGKLSFEDMNSALKAMTSDGGVFFNAMQAQSETFNGKISTLLGNLSELGRALSKLELPKKLVDEANKLAKLLATELDDDADPTKKNTFMDKVGAAFVSRQALGTGKAFESEEQAKRIAAQGLQDIKDAKNNRAVDKFFEDKDKEAAQRKAEAAARLASGSGSDSKGKMDAQAILRMGLTNAGGTLGSLGGDISGGGFSARMMVQQEQLTALQEIKENTRMMVRTSTTMTDEGRAAYLDSVTPDSMKG